MIKISVIVPVYNTELYLENCLNSLVNQSLKDIEIILINDGSTDNSEKISNKYLKKHKNIKYIYKKNTGQGDSRNLGIKLSKGEFICFVDSDDYIDTNMLEKLYNEVGKSNAEIVYCRSFFVYENDFVSENFMDAKTSQKKFIINNFGPCAKIIKKSIITENNLYFPKLRAYEDISVVPLWGMNASKIAFVDECLYYYLMRNGSTMKQLKYSEKLLDIFQALDNLSLNMGEDFDMELEWIFIENLLHAASLRFLSFKKYSLIDKVSDIMRLKYPNYNKNIYYKNKNFKYKIVCMLIYNKKYNILKFLLRKR